MLQSEMLLLVLLYFKRSCRDLGASITSTYIEMRMTPDVSNIPNIAVYKAIVSSLCVDFTSRECS